MQLVVDTNVFAAAIIRKGDTRRLLFSGEHMLYSPERVRIEIARNAAEFMKKAGVSENEFNEIVELVFENIIIVPAGEYKGNKEEAKRLCPKNHEADWPFLGLALKLNCPLWTGDASLQEQDKVKIITTKQLIG